MIPLVAYPTAIPYPSLFAKRTPILSPLFWVTSGLGKTGLFMVIPFIPIWECINRVLAKRCKDVYFWNFWEGFSLSLKGGHQTVGTSLSCLYLMACYDVMTWSCNQEGSGRR